MLHAIDDDLLMPVAQQADRRRRRMAAGAGRDRGRSRRPKSVAPRRFAGAVDPAQAAQAIAASLVVGRARARSCSATPPCSIRIAAQLAALAQWIAHATGAAFGLLSEAANSVGGYLADALPGRRRARTRARCSTQPRQAYLLLNVRAGARHRRSGARDRAALKAAETGDRVVALRQRRARRMPTCCCRSRRSPRPSGTFVNCEGRAQSFNGAVKPARRGASGWKVLRVLGNLLGLAGFEYDTPRRCGLSATPVDLGRRGCRNALDDSRPQRRRRRVTAAERVADVPMYFADPIVRRSAPLQQTRDARAAQGERRCAHAATARPGAGDQARVIQRRGGRCQRAARSRARRRACPTAWCACPLAMPRRSTLGAMFGADRRWSAR